MSLLEDLQRGEVESARQLPCPLCLVIEAESDLSTKAALITASRGTIGTNKLVVILKANGIVNPETGEAIGRRSIERHRREGTS